MSSGWWIFIPDPDVERAQLIYDEAMGYGRIGLSFAHYMGDLTQLRYDNEMIARKFDDKTGSTSDNVTNSFVRMFRNLLDGISIGDLALYPSTKVDGMLNVGRITSAYKYSQHASFAHFRDVKWLAKYPRETFSTAILKKYPRALAVSPIKDENEFLCALVERLSADGILK